MGLSSPAKLGSFFSYNLSRSYPYKWFTWVILLGGIVATVLFSMINLAANGYLLETIHTNDPNETLSDYSWFDKAPWSWANKISATCAPATLTVGSQYFSSNGGLKYSLDSIWAEQQDGSKKIYPALAYPNSILRNCTVDEIRFRMGRQDSSVESGYWWSWGDTQAAATATCVLSTSNSDLFVNVTTQLPTTQNSASGQLLDQFVSLDPQLKPSLWWGAQLANIWYGPISQQMSTQAPSSDSNDFFQAGWVVLQRNLKTSDITSLDFFLVSYGFFGSQGAFYNWKANPGASFDSRPLSAWFNDASQRPNVSLNIDVFGKSLYSTILTDLGQPGESNALTGANTITYLLSRLSDVDSSPHGGMQGATLQGHPLPDAFTPIQKTFSSPLHVNNATVLFAEYACSVPKRKSGFSLFVSILVADLVLLQALWQLFKLATDTWLARHDPQINYCEGCIARSPHDHTRESIINSIYIHDTKGDYIVTAAEQSQLVSQPPQNQPLISPLENNA